MRNIILCACFFISAWSIAQEHNERYQKQIETLQQELNQLKKKYEENESRSRVEIDHLKQQVQKISQEKESPTKKESETDKALMAEIEKALGDTPNPKDSSLVSIPVGKAQVRLLDISFNALFVAGSSTARESTLRELHGGGHDPKKRGFTVQNLELTLSGAVDPYFNAQANIIFGLTPDGETFVEVEEAFLETSSLPWGFQIKAGQYYTPFGRFNPQHPHSWSFVDQSIINTRLLGGDGTRGAGAHLSWLAPTPWYLELTGGVQNANGLAQSFLGGGHEHDEGEDEHDHEDEESPVFFDLELPETERDVRTFEDLLYSFRLLQSFDVTDTLTLNLGISYAVGPNGTGEHTWSHLVGADLFLKWVPENNNKGFPFVTWHTEGMYRHFEVDDVTELLTQADGSFGGIDILSPKRKLQDWGFFSQMDIGIVPNWVVGLRYDFADSDSKIAGEFVRQDRHRGSFALTYFFTEYSKVRLQYNLDSSHSLGLDREHHNLEHSLWLQWEFLLGSHGAHNF